MGVDMIVGVLKQRVIPLLILITVLLVFLTSTGYSCACGCSVFSVGNKWMMATSTGIYISLQYSYMNQNQNWHLSSSAPADSNLDREIRTGFYTLGFQYMQSRKWGVIAEVPLWDRFFSTLEDNGNPISAQHYAFGDVRLLVMYSGFSEDMSTALLFGLKLPTGPFDQSLFDRDTQIGTGTTDILFRGYQMKQNPSWGWFVQGSWQHALNTREGYRPGDSFDMNIGFHYDRLVKNSVIIPTLQVIGSIRGSDSGVNSEPDNTGYQRIFVAPGVEVQISSKMQLFGDIRIPLFTHVRGYQLVAPLLLNTSLIFNY
jgi:hypothetical protein